MPIDSDPNYVSLLNIDVYEHAYYLDYFFDRLGYLKNIWKVVNWAKVSERLDDSLYKSPKGSIY